MVRSIETHTHDLFIHLKFDSSLILLRSLCSRLLLKQLHFWYFVQVGLLFDPSLVIIVVKDASVLLLGPVMDRRLRFSYQMQLQILGQIILYGLVVILGERHEPLMVD